MLQPVEIRGDPPPLRGGPLAFARFARRNRMLTPGYAWLALRLVWLKLRWRGRLVTDGLAFVCPGVKFEIGPEAKVHLGRWSWIGNDSKVRCHEGEVRIGAKTVLGQECTISAFQHVSIGRECILADRVMLIDFDHGVVEVERPIRHQGIYKRDVRVGHNVWIGYGAAFLRGATVGDNAIVGTYSVVNRDVPDNAVVAGAPARVLRMRPAPPADALLVSERPEDVILELLAQRAPGRTICPSEAARALGGSDPAAWRPLMPAVREAAARLADEGEVEVTQRGEVVDVRVARGPVRLRRTAGAMHPFSNP